MPLHQWGCVCGGGGRGGGGSPAAPPPGGKYSSKELWLLFIVINTYFMPFTVDEPGFLCVMPIKPDWSHLEKDCQESLDGTCLMCQALLSRRSFCSVTSGEWKAAAACSLPVSPVPALRSSECTSEALIFPLCNILPSHGRYEVKQICGFLFKDYKSSRWGGFCNTELNGIPSKLSPDQPAPCRCALHCTALRMRDAHNCANVSDWVNHLLPLSFSHTHSGLPSLKGEFQPGLRMFVTQLESL